MISSQGWWNRRSDWPPAGVQTGQGSLGVESEVCLEKPQLHLYKYNINEKYIYFSWLQKLCILVENLEHTAKQCEVSVAGTGGRGHCPWGSGGTQPSRVSCGPNMETGPHTCLYKQVGPTLYIQVGPVEWSLRSSPDSVEEPQKWNLNPVQGPPSLSGRRVELLLFKKCFKKASKK